MALLKATQPQADLSLQALMFRIDQLETAVGGAGSAASSGPSTDQPVSAGSSAPAPSTPAASSASAPQPRAPKAAPAAAAVAPRTEASPQPVGSVELDQVVALWPAVGEAVAEENGMLSAALSAATPTALDGDRLTIAFPSNAAFVKKKAEKGRDLVANAVRGITGQSLTLAFELSDAVAPPPGPATLDHDQLIERLRAEFGAEEVFDQPDEEKD
jgi:hypothetical protein